jgi:hypothetical protein
MTTLGDVLDRGRSDLFARAAASFPPQSIDGGPAVRIEGPDLAELRSIEIGEVLRTGWAAVRQLREAGHASASAAEATQSDGGGIHSSDVVAATADPARASRPPKPHEVRIGQLSIAFDFTPVLHVSVGPTPVARLTFTMALVVDLVDYRAVVAAGCLVSVGAQALTVRVELTINGHELHSPTVPLSPTQELALRAPIALVPGAKCDTAAPPTRSFPSAS